MSKIQQKWDSRYQNKSGVVPKAPDFLKRHWQSLSPGRVVDLASGDGAAGLFLAQKGFQVSATDISPVGLECLKEHFSQADCSVETHVVDLEQEETDLTVLGQFDSIVIARYKPASFLWPKLSNLLNSGGTLLITTFNLEHHKRTGFSERFCLQIEEYSEIFPELDLVVYEHDFAEQGMDGYLFRKKI
ncbi:bifunctional 2-polyprenyl-6-hydroxyphenol methylase/3-demethylubiquinol 3-O-methyltransferase UbiG [Neptuniibacter sp.]|uniref:class I SAM-dependent methyltransferase n=1 Tax=Neptuniibacter sp. TaxID=1962643 RepID=UPI0026176EE7|nr:class I SAM-dependent methyltransferase [Neptuniibacter sp.]MCP4597852.1 class I SAM-dependent methyltransferase [Neptuniibacter sp.]